MKQISLLILIAVIAFIFGATMPNSEEPIVDEAPLGNRVITIGTPVEKREDISKTGNFLLVETATGKILDITKETFPVAPEWEWVETKVQADNVGDRWDGSKVILATSTQRTDPTEEKLKVLEAELELIKKQRLP